MTIEVIYRPVRPRNKRKDFSGKKKRVPGSRRKRRDFSERGRRKGLPGRERNSSQKENISA